MSYIKIGIIVNTHGLNGEVKAKNFTDEVERFEDLDYVYIDTGNGIERFNIEGIRYAKSLAILKFEDYDNINEIESFKGSDIYIDNSQLRELPEDTYHVFDLIGLSVNENGKFIGKSIDLKKGIIEVELIEGMF